MTDYPDIWPDSDAFIGVCQDCGRTCLVRRTTCPYAKEINGEINEVVDAMESAAAQSWGNHRTFRYFCGICWSKIKATVGAVK